MQQAADARFRIPQVHGDAAAHWPVRGEQILGVLRHDDVADANPAPLGVRRIHGFTSHCPHRGRRHRLQMTQARPSHLKTMSTSSMRTMTGESMNASHAEWRRVGVGDVVVSQNAKDLLTTNGPVGSCVAVYLWDPESRVGGLLHFEWPDSGSDPIRARAEPAVFADTG